MRMMKLAELIARHPKQYSCVARAQAFKELSESAHNLSRHRKPGPLAQERQALADKLAKHENPF